MDWSKAIFHTCPEHLEWALAEKARLDVISVPEGKVVFLGSNPSCSSPYEDPFSHCKSANKMLTEWIPALGLTRAEVHFMNVANYKTPGNRALKQKEIIHEVSRLIELTRGQVVVTLGKSAVLAMCDVVDNYRGTTDHDDHTPTVIEMPHPSGRNRLLNDKGFVQKMLIEARDKIAKARNA